MPESDVHLVVIDPQNDFIDHPGAALPVPGAQADMRRLAGMIERAGRKLSDIHITLDTHHVIDVAHPGFWRGADGRPPTPFTVISAEDIEAGIWRPGSKSAQPAELGGGTLGDYVLSYVQELARRGNYPLMIWPEHCIIGTVGHAIQADVARAVHGWERSWLARANIVVKGLNPLTEHYGGLMAEVPLASDPSTGLNRTFLDRLRQADAIAISGEALSHCVKATVQQIVDHIGDDHLPKLHILTDCTSAIPKVGAGPDFPAIAGVWLEAMRARGIKLTTSDAFLP